MNIYSEEGNRSHFPKCPLFRVLETQMMHKVQKLLWEHHMSL